MFTQEQRYPRLNALLNSYRVHKGCKLIQGGNQLRQLIDVLKANESIGMTVDQGGKNGIQVEFFGKPASMPSGAVRMALKYGASIIPCFYTRVNGPYIKLFMEPPVRIKKTGDLEKDIQANLQEVVRIFERYISRYPQEYLWTYKIWKYSKEKDILVLSDGKAGHLRQAESLIGVISSYLNDKGIKSDIHTVEVKFKNKFCLSDDTERRLERLKPDVVISCGSAGAIVNHRISKENRAKSIVIMRPSVLSMRRFDLVVMPGHDRPPKRKNVALIDGALNLIGPDYLARNKEMLNKEAQVTKELVLGMLLGGDTRNFKLSSLDLKGIFFQVKAFLDNADGELLVTTSRRTPAQVEALVEEEVKDYARCKSAVIANRKNLDYAVGGILGLSKIVLVSPESISMISEAASSGNYVAVFYPGKNRISSKHERFLQSMREKGYIHLCRAGDTLNVLNRLWRERPQVKVLDNNAKLREAIKNIL
jgi:mitochondrial fission protein ELM1